MSIETRLADLEQRFAREAQEDPNHVTADEVLIDPEGVRVLDTITVLCRELSIGPLKSDSAALGRLADDPRGLVAILELRDVQSRVLAYRRYRQSTAHPVPFDLWRCL